MFKNILIAILFRIFVTTILFLIICFTIGVVVSREIDPSKGRYYGERKEYYVFCRIYDEKLDRSRKDEERKCFYECSDKETVVVTTSIGYPCQNSITEKRKP